MPINDAMIAPHRSICSHEFNEAAELRPTHQLILSAELSDYLFSTRFWERVNLKCGTLFDQFEEETAAGQVLNEIIDEVVTAIAVLQRGPDRVRFVRGWTQAGVPIEVESGRDELSREMEGLRNFVHEAVICKKRVCFDL
jgi:hypothetical protein